MTQGAKGRGDNAPPDSFFDMCSRFMGEYHIEYKRTRNPIWVWRALTMIHHIRSRESELSAQGGGELRVTPPPGPVSLPLWCWEYLDSVAIKIHNLAAQHVLGDMWKSVPAEEISSLIDSFRAWSAPSPTALKQATKSELERYEKKQRIMDRFLAGLYMREEDKVTATRAARKLPEILGFVDGAHSNAFYDYWLDEKKKAVARAWDEAQREGKTPKEILDAVSEMTGIYDEPYIRRRVKEAKGKALPRRRSNKPKAPKGKKD